MLLKDVQLSVASERRNGTMPIDGVAAVMEAPVSCRTDCDAPLATGGGR